MKKYSLTIDELNSVKLFTSMRIPPVFKRHLCEYLQFFEFYVFEVCNKLQKGEQVDKNVYDMAVNIKELKKQMENKDCCFKKNFYEYTIEYYSIFLKICSIHNKML